MKNVRIKVTILAAMFSLLAAGMFAYIPENTPENSFAEMIAAKSAEVTTLVFAGTEAVSKEVVSTKYEDREVMAKGHHAAAREASGSESVSTDKILYYEAKQEMLDAEQAMDEINQWIGMYQTKKSSDVVTFKKMKKYLAVKDTALRTLVEVLKTRENKMEVMKLKKTITKADKDFSRYQKLLKGTIELIPSKPLPEDKE